MYEAIIGIHFLAVWIPKTTNAIIFFAHPPSKQQHKQAEGDLQEENGAGRLPWVAFRNFVEFSIYGE
jgi:hypothetical protein